MEQALKRPGAAAGGGARPIRVMIVDDSLVARTVLSRIVEAEPDCEIVAKATTGEMAIARLAETPADVILLDLEMPGMGGIGALPKILALANGGQVLVVSSLTAEGAEHTLAALSMGAADTLLKPRAGEFDAGYGRALVAKIRALAGGPPAEPQFVRAPRSRPREIQSRDPRTTSPHARRLRRSSRVIPSCRSRRSASTTCCPRAISRRFATTGARSWKGCSPACCRRGSRRSRRSLTRRSSARAPAADQSCARRRPQS